MRPVIGIDPSLTATGVCWPDGSTEVIKWPHKGVERLDMVAVWVESVLPAELGVPRECPRWEPLIVLEGYSMGSSRQQSHAHGLGELGGVLRHSLYRQRFHFIDVPPACVKKYATGKGNANKDLVRDAARDRLGLPAGVTSDECDAAWLRQIGLALLFDPLAVEVPKLHREALHKIDRSVLGEAA